MMLLPSYVVAWIAAEVAADHRASATGTDAMLLLAIPILWIAGVVLLIVHKFRAR